MRTLTRASETPTPAGGKKRQHKIEMKRLEEEMFRSRRKSDSSVQLRRLSDLRFE